MSVWLILHLCFSQVPINFHSVSGILSIVILILHPILPAYLCRIITSTTVMFSKNLLRLKHRIIGILGPRRSDSTKCWLNFSMEGIQLSPEGISRVHSPIGLDIGAEAPDEIAISIVSEIQSKFSNRSGGFLKYRNGPIHQRDTASDQVFKQVFIKNPYQNQHKEINAIYEMDIYLLDVLSECRCPLPRFSKRNKLILLKGRLLSKQISMLPIPVIHYPMAFAGHATAPTSGRIQSVFVS